MASRLWTKAEIEELKSLVEKKYTKTQLAEHFDRTPTAIVIKVNRLGLQILNTSDNQGNRGRTWKKSDLDLLVELWQDATVSKSVMQNKLNRTWFSIRKKALELELGAREYDMEYLSIPTICYEMNVSHDRVSNWLKLGLKYKRNKSGKVKYLISSDDLLDFLEEHKDMFNASEVSEYLFAEEPDWFIKKRRRDALSYADNNRLEYTNEEDKIIVRMFNRGKSDSEIARELNRTETGIKYHRMALGLLRNKYSEMELDILRKYSDTKTVYELQKMLPLRTVKGIQYKCEQLNLPYHVSEAMCKSDS